MTHLGIGIRQFRVGFEPAIDRPPGLPFVLAAEGTCRRNRDEHPFGIGGVDQDRVQAQTAGAGLPLARRLMRAQAGQLVPVLAAVCRPEHGGILDSGVDRVGIGQRRLEMPDALEFPGMRGAVVPEMLPRGAVIHELVADGLPGLAGIVRSLQDLPEPAARL
jgi:hypothetical protein